MGPLTYYFDLNWIIGVAKYSNSKKKILKKMLKHSLNISNFDDRQKNKTSA